MIKKKKERWNHIIFNHDGTTTTEFLCCKRIKKQAEKEPVDSEKKKEVPLK